MIRRILAPVLAKVGSRTILTVGGTLFLLNMLIPDPLPLVDEFLILAGTILLSRWGKTSETGAKGTSSETSAPKYVGRSSTQNR